MVMFSELSREVEMALTLKWHAVVGDEFDIVVSLPMLLSANPFICHRNYIN